MASYKELDYATRQRLEEQGRRHLANAHRAMDDFERKKSGQGAKFALEHLKKAEASQRHIGGTMYRSAVNRLMDMRTHGGIDRATAYALQEADRIGTFATTEIDARVLKQFGAGITDDALKSIVLSAGRKAVKTGLKVGLGGVAGLGAEILMPTDLGAADIEDPRYMSPDDPRRVRAERDVAGAEFLAEQPGYEPEGTPPAWADAEWSRQGSVAETQDFNLPRDIADQLAPPVTEYPEEEQLMAAAEDLDATKEEAFASMAPIGDFSKGALNSLVDALNKALPLFGAPEDYATFSEDIEGALPTEFVRYLAMTSQAANDANLGRLAVDLENIGTDSDLMKAAGQLDVLAENDSFRTFMASADKDTAPPVAEEVVEEEVQVQTPISDTEVEAMFVQRAR